MNDLARRVGRGLAAVALAGLTTACSGADGVPKSAGPTRPVELVLTNNDGGGSLDIAPSMAWFIDRVEDLSDGQLIVRFEPGEWATDGREVSAVAQRQADLGWVGTRAFDLLGVDEFRPLDAPLLVDSYELLAAVVRDDDLPAAMLAGIEPLGVTPLGLVADELRFPASVSRPLRTVAEWAGTRVWLLESEAYADAVIALGGRPLHTFESGGDIRKMLQEGDADALATMWVYYALGADYLHAPYVVPNVVLGPRTLVLFANPVSLAELDSTQRGWLERAAADTVAWSAIHAADRVAGFAAEACGHGARVAIASADELAALTAAAAPLYDRLRTGSATGPVMAAIEALAETVPAGSPPAVAPDCHYRDGGEQGRPARPSPLLEPGPTGEFPSGTYRYVVDAADIVRGQDNLTHPSMAGVFTWVMRGGEWTVTARPAGRGVAPVTCRGWYAADGDVVHFTHVLEPDVGHCLPLNWTARWSVEEAGTVTWHPPVPAVLAPHQDGVAWQRID